MYRSASCAARQLAEGIGEKLTAIAADAKVPGTDRKTGDLCIYQDCL